jgi:tetratricopeptide (TPR) repeat protein
MSDLHWLYSNLVVITELDPYFEDAYYFGNAILTWDGGMYNEANALLRKGMEARNWDWQLPFFLGFNKFYFLKDNKGGADYLLEAAGRRGAPHFLPTLAARLYNNAGRAENAIGFLTVFWKNEKNERIKKNYEVRIEALKQVMLLEKAVLEYRRKTGKSPGNLKILTRSGLLQTIPKDPYGGVFYLAKDGSVMTTSNFAFKTKQSITGR